MPEIKAAPFINAQDRRDSLSRLQDDAVSKARPAANTIATLTQDIIETPGIFTGCKEGTDKEKDKEKEKEREFHQPDYFRSIPAIDSAGQTEAARDVADLRIAPGILVF